MLQARYQRFEEHQGQAIPAMAKGPVLPFEKVVDNVSFSFGFLALFVEDVGP